ncbi:hypothetical protein BSAF29S_07183 [Bacillus safensis subsp. safensis]
MIPLIKAAGFYNQGHARADSRSHMNVTFTLRDDALTSSFVEKAKQEQMVGFLPATVLSADAEHLFTMRSAIEALPKACGLYEKVPARK